VGNAGYRKFCERSAFVFLNDMNEAFVGLNALTRPCRSILGIRLEAERRTPREIHNVFGME